MAELSYWWTTDGVGDGSVGGYTQADHSIAFAIIAACRGKEGVAAGYRNELAGSDGGANTVNIASGGALVDGKPYDNTAVEALAIPSAIGAGNTRIDRIVLRADWAAQTVRLTRIAGIDAGAPVAPAITQVTGVTYDILLCQVLVDTAGTVAVTDERTRGQVPTEGIEDDAVTDEKLRDSVALSVIGRSANSAGDPADIQAAANDTFLARIGDVLQWAQLTIGMIPDLLITEAKLAAAVVAKLVTGGDSHDHSGGDGAQIPTAGLDDDAVTDAKLRDAAARSVIGRAAATAGDPADIAAAADNTVLARLAGTLQFTQLVAAMFPAGVVEHDALALESVDDTNLAERVLALLSRQGGHATDWAVAGTTDYTPDRVMVKCGTVASDASGYFAVSYDASFLYRPIVFLTTWGIGDHASMAIINSATSSGFDGYHFDHGEVAGIGTVNWLAIGPGPS